MDLLDLFVKISVDDDDFAQGLKNTEDVIKDTRDEIDSINTTLRKVAGSGADTTELIGLKMELLGDAISATSLKLEDLQSVSDEIKQEFETGRIDTTVYAQYQEDIANTTASLQDLEKQLEQTQNGEQGVAEQTDDLSQKTLSIADIVKGSLISTAITSLIKALDTVKDKIAGIVTTSARLGDTIDKQSQRLGMTTDAYQEWSYILSQNGANISTLTVSMRTLTSQIDGLKSGSAKATQAFGQLGISIDDLAGKTGEEQFSLVVQRLQSIEDTTERNVIANDLLGRSYMQLIPLLNQSSDSIEKLRQKAHDTNQIMGEEGVDAAVDYTDSVDTLSKSFQGFTNRIGTAILPGITDVVKGLTDLLNATNDIDADLAVERIEEGIDRTLESVDTVMPKVSKLIDRVIEAASEKTPDILVALVDGLFNALPSVSVSIIKIAERFIITIIEALPELLPELAEAIVNTLGAVLSETNIVPLVAGVWAGVKALGISADVANLIKLIAGTEGITGAMGAVSTFASATFLPALKNAFSGAFSVLTMEAGEALTVIEAKSVETATVFHTSMATAIETLRVKIKAFGTEAIAVLNGTASAAKIAAVEIGAAAIAVMAIIKVAQELDTISEGLNAQTANEDKAIENLEHFQQELQALNKMPVSIEKYEKLGETLDEIRQARSDWAKVYQETNNRIAELEGKLFKTADETAELERLRQERDSLDAEYESLVLYQTKVENALSVFSDDLIAEIKRQESAEKAALDSKNAMYAGYFAEAEALAQKSRDAAKIVTTGNVGLEAVLQSHLDELEHKLATHKITEQQYWEEKQKWVETFRNEESESWWKYYDQVQGYYDKLSDTEIKAQEQERKKAADAQAKAQKEWEKSVKDGFSALEQMMYDEGKDKSWLVAQERAYIEALDHSSALYKEYNLKVSKEERELAESLEKERKTNQENAQKSFASYVDKMISAAQKKIDEYEKAIDKIKEKISSFASKLAGSFKEIFEFDKDEAGNITAAKTTNVLTDSIKQLEQYYDNIQKLKERKVGDVLLKSLADMSAEEGLAVTEYYKGLSDEQLKSLSQKWDYKQMLSDKVSNAVYGDELEAAEKQLDEERNTLLSTLLTDINKGFSDLVNAYGGQIPNVNVNVNGIQYQSMGDLASAVAKEMGAMTNRKAAGYAV